MKKILTSLLLIVIIICMPAVTWAASWGIDISWPQCGETLGHYNRGVVGVNHGGDFDKNTCLAAQVKHFDQYFLYVNTNYRSDECKQDSSRKAAYHCGYNLGRWDVEYASSQHAYSNLWFVDVETGPGIPWTDNDTYNSVFLYGLGKGIQSKINGALIGYYASEDNWQTVTGDWQGHGFGIWYPIGTFTSDTAKDACNSNYSGARNGVVMYQYIVDNLDHDDLC